MALQPARSSGFLMWHATVRWQRDIARALVPLDLTHVQFVVLACAWWLNTHDECPSQARLAEQAGTDVMTTSQALKSLVLKGLIEHEVDPADARTRRVRVTSSGTELAPRAIAVVEAVDAEFFSVVDATDAIGLLGRLARFPVWDP